MNAYEVEAGMISGGSGVFILGGEGTGVATLSSRGAHS